ncbi:hypothetical protein JCM6882_005148 [Rhodosporidiobolus microsporus]
MSSGLKCFNGCGRPADRKLTCPKCQAKGIDDAQFCSSECFRTNYQAHHQKFHVKVDSSGYVFPEGTHDPFHTPTALRQFPGFTYTGPLRAVYPDTAVPRREIPASIKKPDYATNAEGVSYSERVANRMERVGKILDAKEIEGMRKVCKLAREVLDIAAAAVRPGITTLEIDAIVHDECIKRDSYPSPLNYHMFPRSVCTSLNEVICHGIPDARPLVDGDIINLDVTLYHGGFHGDINGTYPVGPSVSAENLSLIACARECLDESIRLCKPGFAYQDLGKAIEEISTRYGFSTNRTYCGHGINQLFHCMPNVPHYAGNRASGRMQVGQTFTIEPMICVGDQKEVHWPDNWTATTKDGKPSAQFEETLLITPDGVEVLTAAPGWRLPEKNGSLGAAAAAAGAGANGEAAAAAGKGKSKNKKKKKKAKKTGAAAAGAEGEAEDGEEDGEEEEEATAEGVKDSVQELAEKVKETL